MEGWQQTPAPVKLGTPLTAEEREAAKVAQPDPEQASDPLMGWVVTPGGSWSVEEWQTANTV